MKKRIWLLLIMLKEFIIKYKNKIKYIFVNFKIL